MVSNSLVWLLCDALYSELVDRVVNVVESARSSAKRELGMGKLNWFWILDFGIWTCSRFGIFQDVLGSELCGLIFRVQNLFCELNVNFEFSVVKQIPISGHLHVPKPKQ